MTNRSDKRRSTRAQTVGIVTGSIVVLVIAILVTLRLGGSTNLTLLADELLGSSDSDKYQHITQTDAQIACEKETREEFGNQIKFLTPDRHSSRFDQNANRYKMYFWLELTENRRDFNAPSVEYFVNCYVHASRGIVTNFTTLEKVEAKPEVSRRSEGGLFGF